MGLVRDPTQNECESDDKRGVTLQAGRCDLPGGQQLQDVLSDLHRDIIDVRGEGILHSKPCNEVCSTETQRFRIVGFWNEDGERYHLYITNLSVDAFDASEFGLLYRARWEVEWRYMTRKSWFRLDELEVDDPMIIETLMLIVVLSMVVCRVMLDELRELEAQQMLVGAVGSPCERIPRARGILALHQFAGVIFANVMLEPGFGQTDLDELLLFVAREQNSNPNRLRRDGSRLIRAGTGIAGLAGQHDPVEMSTSYRIRRRNQATKRGPRAISDR